MGYVRDSQKQFIYEFYLRSTINELLVFSNVNVTKHRYKAKRKTLIFASSLKRMKFYIYHRSRSAMAKYR